MRSHEIAAEIWQVIELASKDVYRGQDAPCWSHSKLPEPLLTVWAVEQAQGIIDNGGFQYFFENDWPENPDYSVFADAFYRIGAQEAADCIERAVEMFPTANPHLDCDMRRDYLHSLREKDGKDSLIDKLGHRVIDLGGDTFIRLARYISANIDSFPTVARNS